MAAFRFIARHDLGDHFKSGYTGSARWCLQHHPKAHLNAIVIDVKGDRGLISLKTGSTLAAEIGAREINTFRNAPQLVRDLNIRGSIASYRGSQRRPTCQELSRVRGE